MKYEAINPRLKSLRHKRPHIDHENFEHLILFCIFFIQFCSILIQYFFLIREYLLSLKYHCVFLILIKNFKVKLRTESSILIKYLFRWKIPKFKVLDVEQYISQELNLASASMFQNERHFSEASSPSLRVATTRELKFFANILSAR